ncbi:hypothetical protein AAMO2058_001299500 [Amorphochlora amoebiformis]
MYPSLPLPSSRHVTSIMSHMTTSPLNLNSYVSLRLSVALLLLILGGWSLSTVVYGHRFILAAPEPMLRGVSHDQDHFESRGDKKAKRKGKDKRRRTFELYGKNTARGLRHSETAARNSKEAKILRNIADFEGTAKHRKKKSSK